MDLDKLREIIQVFEAANISEIEIEEKGSRILLKKSPKEFVLPPHTHMGASIPQMYEAPFSSALAQQPGLGFAQPASAPVAPEPAKEEEGLATINSPMVGVFYIAPAPGEPSFVEVGSVVEEGQTVCIVEAMKLMNEVTAKMSGVIVKVLVENAEPVEYGQPLFALRPIEEG